MSKPSVGPGALIVDDDLGFVCWLSERFKDVGHLCVPALNARQAMYLVKKLALKITVVVVNPELPGVRGLIKALNNTNTSPLRVIVIRDPTASKTILLRSHAMLERPSGWEVASRHEWLRKLRMALKQAEQTAANSKARDVVAH